MLKLEQTNLETFTFGTEPNDKYHLLINTEQNPVGVDLVKLSKADPRTFDATLNEMGCILMLSGEEIEELTRRNEVDPDNLHESLFNLAKSEGIIK